jgi:4-hydroxybenzoate polyprenyltransferase
MKHIGLALTMLRYRAALMLWMFFFTGIARHAQLTSMHWSYAVGLVALGASYVAATSVNDICDQDVDAINHPNRPDRPLISGRASARDLWMIHLAASVVVLGCGLALGPTALLVLSLSLIINHIYSVSPVRLSRRTFLAPLVLCIAYVLLPYWLGVAASGQTLATGDAFLLAAFMVLFLGRINLKDFRDRTGDARYGKPTFVLRYGKHAAWLVSFTAVLVGNLLLVAALAADWWAIAAIEVQMAAGLVALVMLRQVETEAEELFAIGLAARMANGVLLTVLALLTMNGLRAPAVHSALLLMVMATASCVTFLSFTTRREEVIRAFRG